MENSSYLDAARLGKASVWRYLAGISLILFTWLFAGSLVTLALLGIFTILQGVDILQLTDVSSLATLYGYLPTFLILNVSFLCLLAGIWLAAVVIHRRPLWSVATARPALNWQRLFMGFGFWLFLAALSSLLEYLIWPETFSLQMDWGVFLPFALFALILTPIQTSAEELLFRGYLVQATSLATRNRLALSLVSGILFMLPHVFNPEVAVNPVVMILSYLTFGFFLAWISLRDGSLELALGLHAANNLFAILVVTFPDSALPSPAIFYTIHFDPVFSFFTQLVLFGVFYLIFFYPRKRLAAESDKLT